MNPQPPASSARLMRIALTLAIVALVFFIAQQVWALGQTLSSIISTLAASWFVALIVRPFIHALSHSPLIPAIVVRRVRARYGDSAARRVVSARMPFGLAVGIVYMIVLLLLVSLITIAIAAIIPQASALINRIPDLAIDLPQLVSTGWADVARSTGLDPRLIDRVISVQDITSQATAFVSNALSQALSVATFTASAVGQVVLVIILSLYIVIEDKLIERQFFAVVPRRAHEAIRAAFTAINRSFSGYLRGQVVAALVRTIITFIVFQIFRVGFGVVVGVSYGLLSFVPLIGSPIGIIVAAIVVVIAQPDAFWPVVIVLTVLDFVVAYIVLPRLLSDAVGVPSLVSLISITIGVQLLGFWGLVFSVPIVGAIYAVVFDFWLPRRRRAEGLPEFDPVFSQLVYPRRTPRAPGARSAAADTALASGLRWARRKVKPGVDRISVAVQGRIAHWRETRGKDAPS